MSEVPFRESLARVSPLRDENISHEDYTASLVQEGIRCELVSQEDAARIQGELLLTVRASVERLTKGQSTSVRAEKAQSLLQSNLFSLDATLLAEKNHGRALERLMREDCRNLCLRGESILLEQLSLCKLLYAQAKDTRLMVDVHAYNATMTGISTFFSAYNPIFEAHETPADIDYPLSIDVSTKRGVFYLRYYLTHLILENEFCGKFPLPQWKALLRDCGSLYGCNPRDLMINLFNCALIRSVLSVSLAEKPSLSLSHSDCAVLSQRLGALSRESLSHFIYGAIAEIAHKTNASAACAEYLSLSAQQERLLREIERALSQNALEPLALLPPVPKTSAAQPRIREQALDDHSFRILLGQLNRANDFGEKARILRKHVHSLADLLDLLRNGVFSESECAAFYATLDSLELLLLAKAVFPSELRTLTGESFRSRLQSIRKSSDPFANALVDYLCSLDDVRLARMETAAQPQQSPSAI